MCLVCRHIWHHIGKVLKTKRPMYKSLKNLCTLIHTHNHTMASTSFAWNFTFAWWQMWVQPQRPNYFALMNPVCNISLSYFYYWPICIYQTRGIFRSIDRLPWLPRGAAAMGAKVCFYGTSVHDLDWLQYSIGHCLPLATPLHQVPVKSGQKSFYNPTDKPTSKQNSPDQK